jgi:CheY-like chemotaxis protein/HPt (histidine-containing phosphotransfer) domain-containing protein
LSNAVDKAGASKIVISLKQLLKTDSEVLLEFTVEDNGNAEEHPEKVFALKRGLVRIRTMIEAFGGKTEISSLEGIGTTVKFLVKFKWEHTSSESVSDVQNKLSGKRILVAEDNEINQKIIAHLLRKQNIHTDLANDGKEAVDMFEKNTYDLLLLDLQMPHMDGFQTANYIRKKLKSHIPIIAMTASAFSNEQTRCFEVGINQFIRKPFSPEDLFQRLRYFLLNEHQITYHKPVELGGNRDLYSLHSLRKTHEELQIVEIIEMFTKQTPQLLTQIRTDIELQNLASVIKKTANLKGSLGSLHMHSMMQIVEEIELFIKVEDVAKIPLALNQLVDEFKLIVPLLQREVEEIHSRSMQEIQ